MPRYAITRHQYGAIAAADIYGAMFMPPRMRAAVEAPPCCYIPSFILLLPLPRYATAAISYVL